MGIWNLRYAWRMLGRSPLFTLVAAATLALGIGGACAIFTVADAVMLRPLPYAQPGWLILLSATQGPDRLQPFSYDVVEQIGRYRRIASVELCKKDTDTHQITAKNTSWRSATSFAFC